MDIKTDSRKIKPGDTFVAIKGISSDGHDYIEKAIENGACKIICEHGSYPVETEIVENTREYLLKYLTKHYQSYLEQMTIIGITGTNGKTTSAYLLYDALRQLGTKTAYIGTIGFYTDRKVCSLANTTPDICELYEMILTAYEEGCQAVVLEVSSQGVSYHRVDTIQFDYAIFTNLTQDHLDYHKTMGNYAIAKQQLFKQLKPTGKAIVNDDDSYKEYYILKENQNITYGFSGGTFKIKEYQLDYNRTTFTYQYQNKKYKIESNLIGKYNIYNVLTVIIILQDMGYEYIKFSEVIKNLQGPPGRMDMVPYKSNNIIIDYAHTPDAMNNLFTTIKGITDGNIYVVFGCTGDRDRLKRPIMTRMATDFCKYAILTSDDLHNESFSQIIEDMTDGVENTNYEICQDRKEAIKKGIQLLQEKDILLILGKGHEEVMIVKDEKIPFNDKKVVIQLLTEKK